MVDAAEKAPIHSWMDQRFGSRPVWFPKALGDQVEFNAQWRNGMAAGYVRTCAAGHH